MNIAMWRKAVTTGAPIMGPQEWGALDLISKWLISTRAQVLIMTFISAAIGGLWAIRTDAFQLGLWALVTSGLVLSHATNNLVNDLTDYWKGVDKDNYFRAQYGPQPLAHNLMTWREMLVYVAVTGCVALGIGIYLMLGAADARVAWALLGAGAFFVLFYTFPLKYIGLGEIAVLIVWGPLMMGGTYFIVAGQWDWTVVWAGLPYALGTTAVIFGKHIDKYQVDQTRGIRTLPVLLGERRARYAVTGMMIAQYALVTYLVLTGVFTPALLVVFFAVPLFLQVAAAFRQSKPAAPPAAYPPGIWPLWFVALAFVHNRRFGLLFLGGLLVDVLLHGFGLL